ncbi:MAG: TonB-dependent receptor [candidate division KSB1 bacterium]|nr:TonB-dependent receptor [candidate division KSB1 bacterium]
MKATLLILGLCLTLLPIVPVFAATATITGIVRDATTSEPLQGVNVFIENTFIGASTDVDGRYSITQISPGAYQLRAGYIGYKSSTQSVQVQSGQALRIHFSLTPTALQTQQVIVTGSRQPEPLESAASSINVLSKESIRRRNHFRMDEALQTVPGVTIVGENVNIRGGSGYNRLGGSRTLVLLDNVPILTSDLGSANWNILPVTEVDHMEVLKGAASSLYGSGALSGVVNILTRQPSENQSISFRHTSGIYDEPYVPEWDWTDKILHFHRTDVSYSDTYGPVGVRLAVSHHQSTGDRENGSFQRWYMTGKAVAQLSGQSTLTLFSAFSTEERDLFLQWMEQDQALRVPRSDRGDRISLNGFVGYAVYNKLFSPVLATKARLSFNQQLVGLPFNITSAFTPAIGLSGEWQMNWKPADQHSLLFGIDYKYDTVESKYYGRRQANGLSPYLQEIWNITNLLQLNAGLRYDTYILVGDSVETQLSPRIGFSYQPVAGTVLHGSAGRGFRAATVVERFIDAGSKDFRARPNPGLDPERSTLLDLGVRQTLGDIAYLELTGFINTYSNLIEPTLSTDLTARFINTPQARIHGLEALWQSQFWQNRFSLTASATLMDPEEIKSGKTLYYRPRFTAFVSPAFQWKNIHVHADYRTMSRLDRVAVYPLDERVPTKVLDLTFEYQWNSYRFQFLIKNALNYNYTVSERVLGEIRHFALSVWGRF